jgi:hypothetical protein
MPSIKPNWEHRTEAQLQARSFQPVIDLITSLLKAIEGQKQAQRKADRGATTGSCKAD